MKHKYYASYTGIGEFQLLTEKQYNDRANEIEDEGDGRINEFINQGFKIFSTLAVAKKFIRECIQSDRDSLQIATYQLNKIKARPNKTKPNEKHINELMKRKLIK